jgi:hypothetical protein
LATPLGLAQASPDIALAGRVIASGVLQTMGAMTFSDVNSAAIGLAPGHSLVTGSTSILHHAPDKRDSTPAASDGAGDIANNNNPASLENATTATEVNNEASDAPPTNLPKPDDVPAAALPEHNIGADSAPATTPAGPVVRLSAPILNGMSATRFADSAELTCSHLGKPAFTADPAARALVSLAATAPAMPAAPVNTSETPGRPTVEAALPTLPATPAGVPLANGPSSLGEEPLATEVSPVVPSLFVPIVETRAHDEGRLIEPPIGGPIAELPPSGLEALQGGVDQFLQQFQDSDVNSGTAHVAVGLFPWLTAAAAFILVIARQRRRWRSCQETCLIDVADESCLSSGRWSNLGLGGEQ